MKRERTVSTTTTTDHHTVVRKRKRLAVAAVGLVIGVLLTYILFRGTNWTDLFTALQKVHPGWLTLALAAKFGTTYLKAFRWKYIVRTSAAAKFRHIFSATSIAALAHGTLPIRAGNVVRAFVLGRLARIPFPKSFALTVVDNLGDMIALSIILVIGMAAFPTTHDVILPAETFDTGEPITFSGAPIRYAGFGAAGAFGVLLVLLVAVYVNQKRVAHSFEEGSGHSSTRLAQRGREALSHFAQGLHIFRSYWEIVRALALTALNWSVWLAMHVCVWNAFDMPMHWTDPFMIQALIIASMGVPGAPGFIGAYHIAIVVAVLVAAPGADASTAKAMALVSHAVYIIPVAVLGVACLLIEHLRPRDITPEQESN